MTSRQSKRKMHRRGVCAFIFVMCVAALIVLPACAQAEPASKTASGPDSAPPSALPTAHIVSEFEPPGESNVRSSFRLENGAALIGTEETGDIYKTTDGGVTWKKAVDGGDAWQIQDVRNFIRAKDGRLYATTSEPALVLRSDNEGASWDIVARPKASRTVGLVQLDDGTFLVGLRRSENNKISIIRSADGFKSFDWVALSDDLPRQNVTCLIDLGGGTVLAGIGYEESGKIFKSTDAGLSWRQTADFPDARDLMSFFRAGDRIFVTASGIATLYASDDGGDTWGKAYQVWDKGFLGEAVSFTRNGQTYHVLSATDQRAKPLRHVLLISADGGQSWQQWIELARDDSGGASNLEMIDEHTLIAGTGNHSAQGRVYTIKIE